MIKKLTSTDFKISNWSGGSTKELYIFPETAQYNQRNFNFRLSIATTEKEESTFTSLPNINRFLSILNGQLFIEHENKYSRTLLPFEIENFDGSWITKAKGKVTDFNLMLKNCNGNLQFKEFSSINNFEIINKKFIVIYCILGSIIVNDILINKNEILIIENEDIFLASTHSKVFLAEIYDLK